MPTLLDPDAFRAALARGLGRCVQQLQAAAGPGPWRPALLDAFGRTVAHDPQCEGTRVAYLLDLAAAASMQDELRSAALDALPGCDDRWDLDQHTAIALALARDGDEGAAAALRSCFDAAAAGSERFDSLAWGVVRLEGLAGLRRVMRRLAGSPGGLEDGVGTASYLRSVAADEVGQEAVDEALTAAAQAEPGLAALIEAVRAVDESRRAPRARVEEPSFEAVLAAARAAAARGAIYPRTIGWGRRASEEQRRQAAGALAATDDPWLQQSLARVWWYAQAGPLEVLLPLAGHAQPAVARAARRALRHVNDPAVRQLAWRLLEADRPVWDAFGLLSASYRPGDGDRVAARLAQAPDDVDDLHEIGLGLLEAMQGEGRADDVLGPLRWLYEHTPCSRCRHDAVVALVRREALTPAMREECRWDSEDETRELARDAAG